MEDYIVILLMCCVWVVLGIAPFQIAFGSFSSTTIWLLIAAMGDFMRSYGAVSNHGFIQAIRR